MNTCEHYHVFYGISECWNTNVPLKCSCNGDERKCDLFSHVKKTADVKSELENEFEVGDVVITSDGKIGVIDGICRCLSCVARGFYEPSVTILVGNDAIYITDIDARNNFRSFYKIGKHIFGNIDMDDVKYDIENENKKVQEAATRVRKYREQLRVLEKLEKMKDGADNE